MGSTWQRVTKRRPCAVCSKPDWCLFAGPADAPTAVICPWTVSPQRCGEAGFLHELRHDGPTWAPWRRSIRKAVKTMSGAKPGGIDFNRLAAECQAATKPRALGRLADNLGLSVESLRRLSVGWSGKHSAWAFPMQDADGKVVAIRLRRPDGSKRSVWGGHEGLFVPDGLHRDGLLLINEGPTDTAALDLPDGRRLWAHPQPTEPSPTTRPAWSADSRRAWLEGQPAPNPADVFKAAAERVAYSLDLPKSNAPGITATVVCWSMLTYCYSVWPAVPYLFAGGPLGSGKSRLLDILGRLTFRPVASSNMTAPALFRTLHTLGGTLFLDEAERLRNTTDPATAELLSMLLAGYRKGGQARALSPWVTRDSEPWHSTFSAARP